MTRRATKRKIVYLVRTNSLQREGRIAKLFRVLEEHDQEVEIFGVVNRKEGFKYRHREYICKSDKYQSKTIKILAKLAEIQYVAFRTFRRHLRNADLLIIANHEFLFVGLLLRIFYRVPIIVDLHEHYFASVFGRKWLSRFLFLFAFSGVIFANRHRAIDFLGPKASAHNVVVVRNFPDDNRSTVIAPSYCQEVTFCIAIVGGDKPGRFIHESVLALDHPLFADSVSVKTFGDPIGIATKYVKFVEHGAYRHWEIHELLQVVDASLVFYDPTLSNNNRLCEPNRFFEAYNMGKVVFCFNHSSLSEFYDDQCKVINQQQFVSDFRNQLGESIEDKRFNTGMSTIRKPVQRSRLVFDDGIENLGFLLGKDLNFVAKARE